jgi:uncharacterized DUF497 family protein
LFEWDDEKTRSIRRKHGVDFDFDFDFDFDDAIEVFYDPHSVVEQNRVVDGEVRWQTIGMVGDVVVLQVAHTVDDQSQDEVIRIISARRASRKERKRYEQNC